MNYNDYLKQLDEMDLRLEHYETLSKMFKLQREIELLREKHNEIQNEVFIRQRKSRYR